MSDCVDSDDAITKVRMLEPRPPPAWSSQDTVDQAMTGLLSSAVSHWPSLDTAQL